MFTKTLYRQALRFPQEIEVWDKSQLFDKIKGALSYPSSPWSIPPLPELSLLSLSYPSSPWSNTTQE